MNDKEVLGIDDVKSKELKRRHPGIGRRRRPEIGRKINEPYNRKRYDISSRLNLNSKLANTVQKSSVDINTTLYDCKEDINFSYNILEIILNAFFFCCLPKYLERKKKLTEKANNLLNKKLDVFFNASNFDSSEKKWNY